MRLWLKQSLTGLSIHEAQEILVLVLKLNLVLLDRLGRLNLVVAIGARIPLKRLAQWEDAIEVGCHVVLKLPRLRQNAQIPKSILRFWVGSKA